MNRINRIYSLRAIYIKLCRNVVKLKLDTPTVLSGYPNLSGSALKILSILFILSKKVNH